MFSHELLNWNAWVDPLSLICSELQLMLIYKYISDLSCEFEFSVPQLFGTSFSKLSLRQLICQNSFQLINKAFRHVETLFIQGRNLYFVGLLLVIHGLFTFRQLIAGLQGTSFYLGQIKFLHVERPYWLDSSNLSIKKVVGDQRQGGQILSIATSLWTEACVRDYSIKVT